MSSFSSRPLQTEHIFNKRYKVEPSAYKIGDSDTRPWGAWEVLDAAPNLVVKKLTVAPLKRTSLQCHRCRAERWIIMQGVATVQKDKERLLLHPGDGVLIPQNCLHRLSNDSEEPVIVLEVQFGESLREDDIERLDDDFGRHGV